MDTNKRIKILEAFIQAARELYYNNGTSPFSDKEYDTMEEELRNLDPDNKILNQVGSYSMKNKIMHPFKMYSLDKAHSLEEISTLTSKTEDIYVMYKYDGLSLEATYINGKLSQLSTRGDGKYGESVLRHAHLIKGLPTHIDKKGLVCVYGECFISKADFNEMKDKLSDEINDARNLAAGTLKCDDKEIVKSRNLQFVAYRIMPFEKDFIDQMHLLEEEGFKTAEILKYQMIKDKSIDDLKRLSSKCECETDGIVFMINNNKLCEELGFTSHHPRYALALKFKDESVISTVEKIELSISRNGTLSPVAIIKEVIIDKAKITRVSMTNIDNMILKNVTVGSTVEVVRANKVIPKIISGELPEGFQEYQIPEQCPYCSHKIEVTAATSGIRTLRCDNDLCVGRLGKILEHWCDEMRIDGMGEKNCLAFAIEFGYRNRNYDISPNIILPFFQSLEKDIICNLMNSVKIGSKIYNSMKSKHNGCRKVDFIAGLGITSFGRNSYETAVNKFKDYDIFKILTSNSFSADANIFGPETAKDISLWKAENLSWLTEFIKTFVFEDNHQNKTVEIGKLSGKSICITGTLSSPRGNYEQLIKQNGGIVSSSVSKNTSYLLAGSDCGSKLEKANKLGVKVINEMEFAEMIR